MFCKNCGKQIDDKASICIYCGVATGINEAVKTEERKVNAFGIAGFVVSLVSLWLGMYFCIASIIGLALSIVGMVNAKKCKLNGFAIAGLVLGIISLVIWAIVWIAVGAVILAL
ncbi:MAG: zinc ribbon domain-containing protein [Clostridia bacterium]|nr:zinc ribbon domain-containing protein [Clostridia bacterium]